MMMASIVMMVALYSSSADRGGSDRMSKISKDDLRNKIAGRTLRSSAALDPAIILVQSSETFQPDGQWRLSVNDRAGTNKHGYWEVRESSICVREPRERQFNCRPVAIDGAGNLLFRSYASDRNSTLVKWSTVSQ